MAWHSLAQHGMYAALCQASCCAVSGIVRLLRLAPEDANVMVLIHLTLLAALLLFCLGAMVMLLLIAQHCTRHVLCLC